MVSLPKSRKDHPRVGGEKWLWLVFKVFIRGSPPRWRGKVISFQTKGKPHGITPALAGKRTVSVALHRGGRDHPRVGGEKREKAFMLARLMGSPPRWRGKALDGISSSASSGITPALAGKRTFDDYSYSADQDHPRVGGEKTKKIP